MFSSPITRERLAACGKGAAAEKLQGAIAQFRRQAAHCEAELDVLESHFDDLLAWAVGRARQRGHVTMPWERPGVAAAAGKP